MLAQRLKIDRRLPNQGGQTWPAQKTRFMASIFKWLKDPETCRAYDAFSLGLAILRVLQGRRRSKTRFLKIELQALTLFLAPVLIFFCDRENTLKAYNPKS